MRSAALVCAGVGLAAAVAPLLATLAGVDYFTPRYLVAVWVPLSAALASLLAARSTRVGAVLAALVCLSNLAVVAAVDTRPQLQPGDWRGVADALRSGPADRAVVIAVIGAVPLEYYRPYLAQVPAYDAVSVREIDLVGYAPLLRNAERPPRGGFKLSVRHSEHGLIVLRFRSLHPVTSVSSAC